MKNVNRPMEKTLVNNVILPSQLVIRSSAKIKLIKLAHKFDGFNFPDHYHYVKDILD